MAKVRGGDEGITRREAYIQAWEKQIALWTILSEKSPAIDRLREATALSMVQVKKEMEDRVNSLSIASEADRLDLAKLRGKLDGLESVYYDIADAGKKIEHAKLCIVKLADEIKRIKKGELLDEKA